MIEPYLFFNGSCRQAIDFYRKAVDAEVEMTMRYADSPEPPPPGAVPDDWDDKIMHASVSIGGSRVMMSDGNRADADFVGFSLSLTAPDAATADRYFAALSEGGDVTMPMGSTFWSERFGMTTDRFGVHWMVTVPVAEPSSRS